MEYYTIHKLGHVNVGNWTTVNTGGENTSGEREHRTTLFNWNAETVNFWCCKAQRFLVHWITLYWKQKRDMPNIAHTTRVDCVSIPTHRIAGYCCMLWFVGKPPILRTRSPQEAGACAHA